MRRIGKNLLILVSCILMTGAMASCDSGDSDGSPSTPGGDSNPFAGSYSGTFSGDDAGDWSMQVANDGAVTGRGHSSVYDEDLSVSGELGNDGQLAATVGGTSSEGATWSGRVNSDGAISGTWNNSIWHMSGTFVGGRN